MAELESELQKASYEAYNAEHQLTQLSLKVRGFPERRFLWSYKLSFSMSRSNGV